MGFGSQIPAEDTERRLDYLREERRDRRDVVQQQIPVSARRLPLLRSSQHRRGPCSPALWNPRGIACDVPAHCVRRNAFLPVPSNAYALYSTNSRSRARLAPPLPPPSPPNPLPPYIARLVGILLPGPRDPSAPPRRRRQVQAHAPHQALARGRPRALRRALWPVARPCPPPPFVLSFLPIFLPAFLVPRRHNRNGIRRDRRRSRRPLHRLRRDHALEDARHPRARGLQGRAAPHGGVQACVGGDVGERPRALEGQARRRCRLGASPVYFLA